MDESHWMQPRMLIEEPIDTGEEMQYQRKTIWRQIYIAKKGACQELQVGQGTNVR